MKIPYEAMTFSVITKDDPTPGYVTASGRDHLGTSRIFVFKGDEPSADGFRGSIRLPAEVGRTADAYGRGGGRIASDPSYSRLLLLIVERG